MKEQRENFRELFCKDAGGRIRFWSIWNEDNIIYMEHGQVDGESVCSDEIVDDGLAGRTLEEQVLSRIESRYNKKVDAGYVPDIRKAEKDERTNGLGFKRPAKCSAYNGSNGRFYAEGWTGIQKKLNGHHANVVNDNGTLKMYSSNGKIIDTMPELLEGLELPEDRTIEGELYCHGIPLQTISSWVKRRQPDSHRIEYHIYDICGTGRYQDRFSELQSMKMNDRCKVVHTDFVTGEFNLEPLLKSAIDNKFEGLVLRLDGFGHMAGRRTKALVKVKPRHFKNFRVDDEFLVVNIFSSKDGWARLQCETEEGKKFMVSCHGDIPYKTHVLEHKSNFIGKHIRCEFESYTKDKVPFHPVALEWREKHLE